MAHSLPSLDGAFLEGCNGGEGQGHFSVSMDAGPVDLVVLCEGAESVTIATDPGGPIPSKVTAECPAGPDPVHVRVVDLQEDVATIVKIAQQGEGETAWFLVPAP